MSRDMIASQIPTETPIYLAASLTLSMGLIYIASKFFSLETLSTLQFKAAEYASRLRRRKTVHKQF
jgi:ABC-2 type transport system permease protein